MANSPQFTALEKFVARTGYENVTLKRGNSILDKGRLQWLQGTENEWAKVNKTQFRVSDLEKAQVRSKTIFLK